MKNHVKKAAKAYRIMSGVITVTAFASAYLGASTFDFQQSAYCAGEMALNEMTPAPVITAWMAATIGMFVLGIIGRYIAIEVERYGSIH